ncbi:MAG: hypothetical protein PHG04_02215 [Candidatus Nanoarchaeia archaeon]|nr:hypothetical protein [Candidatus Nanoarchaeia archaeon]
MDTLCAKCKGRNFCNSKCKWAEMSFKSFDFKKDFSGSSPSIFIGKANYPNVSIGIMSLPFSTINAGTFDSPKFFAQNLSISQVIGKRALLINCNSSKKSFAEKIKDLALSKKAVEIEASLSKAPKPKTCFDFVSPIMGPATELKKLFVHENIKIDKNVSKCHYDTDLKANEAISILYSKGFEENDLSKYLSSGAFGIKKNRKIVPTRWSITAVDDLLGKGLIEKIKHNPMIEGFKVFRGALYGNEYTIILLPFVYGFELFETLDCHEFMHDFEDLGGRKNYAFETAGGYYACRLAVLEYLMKNNVQARAIVFRKITSEYIAPLGVWVVREACRKAMNFSQSLNDLGSLKQSIKEEWMLKKLMNESVLIKKFLSQKSLGQFS